MNLFNSKSEIIQNCRQSIIDKFFNVGIVSNFSSPQGNYLVHFLSSLSLKIKLSPEEIDYLFKNSNLNSVLNPGATPALMFYLAKYQKIKYVFKISDYYLHYLISNADLKQSNEYGFNALYSYFRNAREEGLILPPNLLDKLIDSCGTESYHNLLNTIIAHDYGYTQLTTEQQKKLILKISMTHSLEDINFIVSTSDTLLSQDKISAFINSFSFTDPVVYDFFYELNNYPNPKPSIANSLIDQKLTKTKITELLVVPPTINHLKI